MVYSECIGYVQCTSVYVYRDRDKYFVKHGMGTVSPCRLQFSWMSDKTWKLESVDPLLWNIVSYFDLSDEFPLENFHRDNVFIELS